MRASIIAVAVLLLLSLIIICNGVYISFITNDLINEIKGLEPSDEKALNDAYEHWEKHHFYICLSSPHEKTDKIEESFIVLLEKAKTGENEGFYEYRAMLLNYIEEIYRIQAISLDSII